MILPIWHGIDEEYLERKSPLPAAIVGVGSDPPEEAVEAIGRRPDHRREAGSSGAALVAAQDSGPTGLESDPERLVRTGERVKLGYTQMEKRGFGPDGGGGSSVIVRDGSRSSPGPPPCATIWSTRSRCPCRNCAS